MKKKAEIKTSSGKWSMALMLFSLLGIAAFLFGFNQITDADSLWHLKSGWLVAQQGPPHRDIFSFRTAGREWIDAQWLFQLGVYLVYRLSGFAGLSIFTGLMIALAWLLLCHAGWDANTGPLTWFLFMLALWASSDRFNLRPEILSFLLVAIYFYLLERDRTKPSRAIFLLVFCQLLWANLEGLWPIGLAIIGAYALEALLTRYFRRPWLDQPVAPAPGRLIILLVLCVLASFATPYHYQGFFFPLTLLREVSSSNFFKDAIMELRRPFAEDDVIFLRIPFLVLIAFSTLSFGLNRRKIRPAHLSLWAVFLYLAWSATRNVALFSVTAAFFASLHFRTFWGPPTVPAQSRLLKIVRQISLTAGIALALFYFISLPANKFYAWDHSYRIFGAGFPEGYDLEKAADFLKQAGWKGKLYCDEVSSGYLIWIGSPDWKVYVDGRLELYGPELIKDAFESSGDIKIFTREDLRWGFDAAIFARARTQDFGSLELVNRLYADPSWVLVYLDSAAALFLKDTPAQHKLVERYKIDLKPNRPQP